MVQAILAGLQVGASLYEGSTTRSAYKAQASLVEDDARLLKWEAERDAAVMRDDGQRYAKEQAMAYVSSGVQMSGSALLITAETIKMSEAEAGAIEFRGDRMYDAKMREASNLKKQGKASFISSVLGGGAKGYATMQAGK